MLLRFFFSFLFFIFFYGNVDLCSIFYLVGIISCESVGYFRDSLNVVLASTSCFPLSRILLLFLLNPFYPFPLPISHSRFPCLRVSSLTPSQRARICPCLCVRVPGAESSCLSLPPAVRSEAEPLRFYLDSELYNSAEAMRRSRAAWSACVVPRERERERVWRTWSAVHTLHYAKGTPLYPQMTGREGHGSSSEQSLRRSSL